MQPPASGGDGDLTVSRTRDVRQFLQPATACRSDPATVQGHQGGVGGPAQPRTEEHDVHRHPLVQLGPEEIGHGPLEGEVDFQQHPGRAPLGPTLGLPAAGCQTGHRSTTSASAVVP